MYLRETFFALRTVVYFKGANEVCLASVWTRMIMPAAGGKHLGFFAIMSAQMSRNHSAVSCTAVL